MPKPVALEFYDADKADAENWFLLEEGLRSARDSMRDAIEGLGRLAYKPGSRREYEITGDRTHTQIEAAFVFAVTMYLRCFATGRRIRLQLHDVPKLTKTDRATHENIRVLRNKHFAHPVTDQHEGCQIYLIVSSNKRQKLGFQTYTVRQFSESVAGMHRIERLIDKVRKHVEAKGHASADKLAKKFYGKAAKWSQHQYQPAAEQ